ncbi:MAG: hypothetical protein Q4C60_07865 [Eubacteriales bacterium]|nr:hypothetical protein [Eubacteriales bacterium]
MGARAPARSKIQASLERQLWKQGANIECFQDLIYDYMKLYDVKNLLQKDIKTRGVSYKTMGAGGYEVEKQNQSVKDLVAVNKQMLLILEKLRLTTDSVENDDDEEL